MSIKKSTEGEMSLSRDNGVFMVFVSDPFGVTGLNVVTLTLLSWDACNDGDSHTL